MKKCENRMLFVPQSTRNSGCRSSLSRGSFDLAVLGHDLLPRTSSLQTLDHDAIGGLKPERTTRNPSTIGPSSTRLVPTVPSSATVKTILLA